MNCISGVPTPIKNAEGTEGRLGRSLPSRSQAPFLDRRYPASSVLRACPLPRRERPGASDACLPRPPATFPFNQEGRLPHCPFRGLLDVHSRSGLLARQAAHRRPFTPECFDLVVTSVNRSGCFQPKRQGLVGVRTRWDNAPFLGTLTDAGQTVTGSFRSQYVRLQFRTDDEVDFAVCDVTTPRSPNRRQVRQDDADLKPDPAAASAPVASPRVASPSCAMQGSLSASCRAAGCDR